MGSINTTVLRRGIVLGAATVTVALLTTGAALGALVGTLPTAGFTFTSVTDNAVNMTGNGVHLKTKGSIDIKTTYSRVAPGPDFVGGWHHHNGPVIVTVTVGTLTLFDAACNAFDVTAGHTYIESTGEILNAKILPDRNPGVSTAEWFTTRLIPAGLADPAPEDAPCTP